MARKKSKQARRAEEWAKQSPQEISWKTIAAILFSIATVVGLIVNGLDFINYLREGYQQFLWLGVVVLGLVWLIILWLLFKQRNIYGILWFSVTILAGVVVWNGWQSYNQEREDKVIVLVAQFDGPEETYGLRRQMIEDLREATKDYDDTVIIEGDNLVTSSEYARELGEKSKADLVIWAWYRPTENPNITIHIENLSPTEFVSIQESETYQPQATLAELESFEIQRQLGTKTSTLVAFIAGVASYEAGDYKTANERFEQIRNKNDISTLISKFDLFFFLGFSNQALGNYNDSVVDYSKAIELNPEASIAYSNRGLIYCKLGDCERSIQDFDKAIQIEPQFSLAYNNRGFAYYVLGDYEHAIQDLDKAIELDPQSILAYNNRGNTYSDLGDYNRAIQEYDLAIQIDPNHDWAYNNRGTIYHILGETRRAIQDYGKAIKINPQVVAYFANRGNAYANLGEYELAINDYNKAIEIDPQYANTYYNRALAYRKLGKAAEAEADFKKYEELTGQKPPINILP